jgi:hypothetical protein
MERRGVGGLYVDGLSGADLVGGALGAAIDEDAAGFDPLLDAGAAVLGEMLVEEMVEALAGVGGLGSDEHKAGGLRPPWAGQEAYPTLVFYGNEDGAGYGSE